VGLSSYKFVQWAPKDASILQQSAGRKRILTSKFKVIHFAISYRPTGGSILPYNTAGLISEDSEEVATPRISPYTLYFQKLESLAYILVADSMGLASFKFVQWAPKRIFSATECVLAVQGHLRSSKVIQGRKRVCDFLLVPH